MCDFVLYFLLVSGVSSCSDVLLHFQCLIMCKKCLLGFDSWLSSLDVEYIGIFKGVLFKLFLFPQNDSIVNAKSGLCIFS